MAQQLTAPEFLTGVSPAGDLVRERDWTRYRWVYVLALAIGFSRAFIIGGRFESASSLRWRRRSQGFTNSCGIRGGSVNGLGILPYYYGDSVNEQTGDLWRSRDGYLVLRSSI
ncbi:MAG: hypothetical protein WD032_00280 [Nitrospirales bacterium]